MSDQVSYSEAEPGAVGFVPRPAAPYELGEINQLDEGIPGARARYLSFDGFFLGSLEASQRLSYWVRIPAGRTLFVLAPDRQVPGNAWNGTGIGADRLLIARPGQTHLCRIPSGWKDFELTVGDAELEAAGLAGCPALQASASGSGQFHLAPGAAAATRSRFAALLQYAGGESEQSLTSRTEILKALLLVDLGELLAAAGPAEPAAGVCSPERIQLVQEALACLDRREVLPATAAELARRAGTNVWTLQRAFSEVVGVSPYQYLLRLRLNQARDALLRDAVSVTEIASELGFASPSEFSRHYQRFYGERPSETRRG